MELLNRELGTLPRLKVLPWPCAIILFRLLDKSKDKTGLDLVMGNSKSKLNVRSSLTENPRVKKPLYLGMAEHRENKPWFSCKESTSLAFFSPLSPETDDLVSLGEGGREGGREENERERETC